MHLEVYKMKMIIGISGASGIRLSLGLIRELSKRKIEIHTVLTKAAEKVASNEGGEKIIEDIKRFSSRFYMENEIDAPIASSSFLTDGMIIIPCSMNTIAKLAHGIADNLLLRAADIQIKMRNKLVIVPREMPLSSIHLENLLRISKFNTTYIIFPLLTYYHRPETIGDMENFVIGKILDVLGIENQLYKRWK